MTKSVLKIIKKRAINANLSEIPPNNQVKICMVRLENAILEKIRRF